MNQYNKNNNPHDTMLNYTPARRTPIDDFAQWYKENGKTAEVETRNDAEIIRAQYEKDPDSLNSMQLLIHGFEELTQKNEQESLNRQKAARNMMYGSE